MDYQEITTILRDFTAQKGWGKYHNLKEEIADTLIYLFYMCDEMGLDPYQAIAEKMKVNQTRHWKEEEDQ